LAGAAAAGHFVESSGATRVTAAAVRNRGASVGSCGQGRGGWLRSSPQSTPFVLAALWVCSAAAAAATQGAGAATSGRAGVVVLAPKAALYSTGLVRSTLSLEWTAAAQANLVTAARDAIADSTTLAAIAEPAVSPEEQAAIDDVMAVAELLAVGNLGWSTGSTPSSRVAGTDRTLGPTLAFLRERTGADFALGIIAVQFEQADELAILSTATSVALTLVGPGFALILPATPSFIAAFVQDLRTGEITWFNARYRFEVAGINILDLREPESTAKLLRRTLEDYPVIRALKGTKRAPSVPASTLSRRQTSPLAGEFALNAPADWSVDQGETAVDMSRDGKLVNRILVEFRDHDRAFPSARLKSTRDSTPQDLARSYLEDLRGKGVENLQVIELSYESRLVGQPAFRIRFAYELPLAASRLRMEQVVVGTAVRHGVILAGLTAPRLNYFEKALPAFEAAAASVVTRLHRNPR